MMMSFSIFFIIFSLLFIITISSISAATCNLSCPPNVSSSSANACTTDYATAVDCLRSIPFNSTIRSNVVEVLSRSLENYGLKDIVRNSGPPYYLQSNFLFDIQSTLTKEYLSDWEFEEDIQNALNSIHDAHTRWSKPLCYDAILVSPFAFKLLLKKIISPSGIIGEKISIQLIQSIYYQLYLKKYPEDENLLLSLLNKEIAFIDGLEAEIAIAEWSKQYETRSNDPAILFNAGIRSFLYRSQRSTILPKSATYTFTTADSTPITATIKWLVTYSSNFANHDSCIKKNKLSITSSPSSSLKNGRSLFKTMMMEAKAGPHYSRVFDADTPSPHPLQSSILHKTPNRKVIIAPGASPSTISCFLQYPDSSISNGKIALVMKVASFSPDGFYRDSWSGFVNDTVKCLSAPDYQFLVLDVMQNGGGYVCLGLRLLTLIFDDFNKNHTKTLMTYNLPHSKLMETFVNNYNHNNPYINPQDVEEILNPATLLPFPDGKSYYYPGQNLSFGGYTSTYTNNFVLDCREAFAMHQDFKSPSQLSSKSKITIVTDGTCGSTCASFTKIAQEADVATFIGAGGIWGSPMDVSSFAGGFVTNPGYFNVIANLSRIEPFPQFIQTITWQCDWAVWYSAKQPSRPAQFTQQPPDYRIDFWDFPHVSVHSNYTTLAVSDLYNRLITDTIERINNEQAQITETQKWKHGFIAAVVIAGVLLFISIFSCRKLYIKNKQQASSDSYRPVYGK